MINYNQSALSYRFRDTALRSPKPTTTPEFEPSPEQEYPLQIFLSNLYRLKVEVLCYFSAKPRDPIFSHFVIIHSCHRQTTDRRHDSS